MTSFAVTPQARLERALYCLEAVGKWAVDLGFGGFLEKFEEHWGRRPAKALLALIGLAIVALCLGAVWTTIGKPVVEIIAEMGPSPRTPRADKWYNVLFFVAFVGIGLSLSLALLNRFLEARLNARFYSDTKEARRILSETEDNLRAAEASLADAQDSAIATELVLDEALTYAVANNMVTEAEAAELRSLRTKQPVSFRTTQ